MGVKATYLITRELAEDIIGNHLGQASNEELANMLECFEKASKYRNYSVESKTQVECARYPFKIQDENDFFE